MLSKTKGIIFYTDSRLDEKIASVVRDNVLRSGLPIISVSLKPLNFGRNILAVLEPSYSTMVKQILMGLENLNTEYVFFCEHDVLYHASHFSFTPLRDNIFYYNSNVYRWDFPNDRAVTYDRLLNLSNLCCNRELALSHYKKRLKLLEERGWDKPTMGEPTWLRRMGYEPGTKKIKRGGFWNDDFDTWASAYPNVDIRHRGTFSPPKTHLEDFKWQPTNFREVTLDQIPGWDLKKLI